MPGYRPGPRDRRRVTGRLAPARPPEWMRGPRRRRPLGRGRGDGGRRYRSRAPPGPVRGRGSRQTNGREAAQARWARRLHTARLRRWRARRRAPGRAVPPALRRSSTRLPEWRRSARRTPGRPRGGCRARARLGRTRCRDFCEQTSRPCVPPAKSWRASDQEPGRELHRPAARESLPNLASTNSAARIR